MKERKQGMVMAPWAPMAASVVGQRGGIAGEGEANEGGRDEEEAGRRVDVVREMVQGNAPRRRWGGSGGS